MQNCSEIRTQLWKFPTMQAGMHTDPDRHAERHRHRHTDTQTHTDTHTHRHTHTHTHIYAPTVLGFLTAP